MSHQWIVDLDEDDAFPSNSPVFNYPTADVIIRSSDNVHFRVHKIILSLASPVFADMFDLGKDCDQQVDGLPIIPMLEDFETAKVIEALFRLSYPIADPPLDTVADWYPVLRGAKKYMMEEAVKSLQSKLTGLSIKEPVRAFAVAASLQLEKETKDAAKHSLRLPFPSGRDEVELELISGRTYQRLLEFRNRCTVRVRNLTRDDSWVDRRTWPFFQRCPHCGQVVNESDNRLVASWWREYMMLSESALERSISEAVALADDVLWPPTSMAAVCSQCKTSALTDLKRFSIKRFRRAWATQVDLVISEEVANTTFF
ncbi:hypothetical protein JAAARDRAFT_171671 [Jaapia argillacea MUCL 33604]|uniref:BTB domain-containing protein n=1 Tax=Jaapia argillacea MUCL 33604 TaxID=933084 RepID=A0A067QFV0_9AGAM|nr:hypothetical protein JAAARDRAFT_171671 [Jaapia argillacea MUCL 33604]